MNFLSFDYYMENTTDLIIIHKTAIKCNRELFERLFDECNYSNANICSIILYHVQSKLRVYRSIHFLETIYMFITQ